MITTEPQAQTISVGNETQKIRPGSARPLGATIVDGGTNFAVYSANATQIDICLFAEDDEKPTQVFTLPERTERVFHGFIPGVGEGTKYGLRAHGAWDPQNGLRFNENKLLLDPYARAVVGEPVWGDASFAHTPGNDLVMSDLPNDAFVPKGMIVADGYDWGDDKQLNIPWDETIIYEIHVKGFTEQNPDIPAELRGTYAGLAHPKAIEYLKSLGVSAVELLPVHAFVNDEFLTDQGKVNYWGYSTLGYFAPAARYAANKTPGAEINEFRDMVKALHEAGLEVILDVVFNHTCEGSEKGPVLSFRGLDNRTYYKLDPNNLRQNENFTGTGNTVNVGHPQVMRLVLDSLRYWVQEMHVDGFRFDLAVTLGREYPDFDRHGGFFDAIYCDPVLSDVKLIAEPWDTGPGGYQLGNFPVIWAEWNDKYRDDVRTFWQTSRPILPAMGYRLTGSSDIFQLSGRKPMASLNFIAAHDGFSLNDLVSYTQKHNDANGEGNQDGHNHNIGANYGVEGVTDDPKILALRERQKRNMLATLLFSQGTPMICGGDELGRTQQGNNNAYAQDNAISWYDWNLTDADKELIAFTQLAIDIRKDNPALRRRYFFQGMPQAQGDMKDVTWLHPDGYEMTVGDWTNPELRTLGMRLDGGAIHEIDDDGDPIEPASVLLIFHAGEEETEFTLPLVERGEELSHWVALLSTDSDDGRVSLKAKAGDTIPVPSRTVMIFLPSTELDGQEYL
ncbi:MAG: glycogen debranching protein GlgX [Thermomicrobiales bacterium]|nr:glycogen debranching protein GlgX [Thermomicrobiales bacterium]